MTIQERVGVGAALMDATVPNWYTKVNHETLDMNSCVSCVIGQCFPYMEEYDDLEYNGQKFKVLNLYYNVPMGFRPIWESETTMLNTEWTKAILERVGTHVSK